MSRSSWASFLPPIPGLSYLFGEAQDESWTDSEDQPPSPSEQSEGVEEAGVARFKEVRKLQREMERWKRRVGRRDAEIARLRMEGEKMTRVCENQRDRMMELESEIGRIHRFYQDARRQTQRLQETEERLKLTEELLAARTIELAGAQAFLSTTDRLSEAEVLSIVRDLNETIYQVAVNLAERWEESQSSQTTSSTDVERELDHAPENRDQLARNRDSVNLTFLFQSCLCFNAAKITSRWGHHQDSAVLRSVYQCLSGSEGQAISARWRSLTHTYLSPLPPHSAFLVEPLVEVLDETGSFSSKEQSLDFVKAVALEGIESIIRLALRLESAFLVDVSSSDLSLLFEEPGTIFDASRMADEFGSDGTPVNPGERDKVAAVTELGVGKSVCGDSDGARHTQILLKTKVVLEKDVLDLKKIERM